MEEGETSDTDDKILLQEGETNFLLQKDSEAETVLRRRKRTASRFTFSAGTSIFFGGMRGLNLV